MNNIKIVRMKNEHLKSVCNIRNYYIENSTANLTLLPMSYEDYINTINLEDENYPKFVAIINDEVIGYATVSNFRNSGYFKTTELSIYLDNNLKSKGIGKLLLNKIELACREKKFHAIVSFITDNNENSINFHIKNGYEKVGFMKEVAFKNNKFHGVTVLEKIL